MTQQRGHRDPPERRLTKRYLESLESIAENSKDTIDEIRRQRTAKICEETYNCLRSRPNSTPAPPVPEASATVLLQTFSTQFPGPRTLTCSYSTPIEETLSRLALQNAEIIRLRGELDSAKNRISSLGSELSATEEKLQKALAEGREDVSLHQSNREALGLELERANRDRKEFRMQMNQLENDKEQLEDRLRSLTREEEIQPRPFDGVNEGSQMGCLEVQQGPKASRETARNGAGKLNKKGKDLCVRRTDYKFKASEKCFVRY